MTSRPLENEVGPRRLSEGERAEGDFVRSFTEAPPKCNALVISDGAARSFYALCTFHRWRAARWYGEGGEVGAQADVTWHNNQREGNAA